MRERIKDARGGKVVFLSHCVLNENTRYLGGAFRKGCINEIVSMYADGGAGMVQIPCPEEEAWGGVLKRRLLTLYGSKNTVLYRLRRIILPLFLLYTRYVYGRLAARTAKRIRDYIDSGFSVAGVIGIDGSPSYGVARTLDVGKSFDLLAGLDTESVTAEKMNDLVRECVVDGRGLFTEMLMQELGKTNIEVPYTAHSLLDEMKEPKP